MKLSDFDYNLPDELIAQFPLRERSASCLLYLNKTTGAILHKNFIDLPELLLPDDLLVFNNTRVIPARLFGKKITGGKIEILIERFLENNLVLAHLRAGRSPKMDSEIIISDNVLVKVLERQDDLFVLQFLADEPLLAILDKFGHMPLPPYIQRADEAEDKERYQTIFAEKEGAIAAPTAALHFDENLMRKIADKKIKTAFITLHVGAGTFQPVRVENIKDHKMHAESIEVPLAVCEQIELTKKSGGRVVAVGTTCARSLETAAISGRIIPFNGETDIFIYPGFVFKCVDALITNFHLPKSTLLMLVSAFAGYDKVMLAYKEAVAQRYRFFSYGDAMLIE